ncbi:uncharacterized protein LOC111368668 [Olea europaea var. sylvestris]|uniref:uncharacterized protein LOC111368668 n=1 Tax=Olea europaea var. sylvestris TaxID=158386 RepID=UPI000C1D586B|nr:uncharacterized protein LOC111368668 [Olea europaea var. sylvestris]
MMNTIRCCISCILPCGVLDVIRIVHANGQVEEISGSNFKAEEIMKLHPNHVLTKTSSPTGEGICPKIVEVPPDAELQRGKIYFLMPVPGKTRSRSSTKRKKKESQVTIEKNNNVIVMSDKYLSDILKEKVSTQRDRRRGRVGIWRPHLESISETPTEA